MNQYKLLIVIETIMNSHDGYCSDPGDRDTVETKHSFKIFDIPKKFQLKDIDSKGFFSPYANAFDTGDLTESDFNEDQIDIDNLPRYITDLYKDTCRGGNCHRCQWHEKIISANIVKVGIKDELKKLLETR